MHGTNEFDRFRQKRKSHNVVLAEPWKEPKNERFGRANKPATPMRDVVNFNYNTKAAEEKVELYNKLA